jgi:hypothetical protein
MAWPGYRDFRKKKGSAMPATKRAAKAKVAIKRVGKLTIVSGEIPPGACLPRTLHKGDYVVFPLTSTKTGKLVRRTYKSQKADAAVSEVSMIWEKGVPYLIRVAKPGVWLEICNGDGGKHVFCKCILQ